MGCSGIEMRMFWEPWNPFSRSVFHGPIHLPCWSLQETATNWTILNSIASDSSHLAVYW